LQGQVTQLLGGFSVHSEKL